MFDPGSLDRRHLWGLTLAAGDGRRLQPFVKQILGKALPKQFVNFTGQRSMLEHTFDRAEKLIDAERIITIVGRYHLLHAEVRRQLDRRPKETIVVQPENKETLPGIMLPLMFLHRRCPDAIVALFPSDHFIVEEDRFMKYVRLAVRAVRHDDTRLVLLAIAPRHSETEYGYIIPARGIGTPLRFGVQPVSAFVEKPGKELAHRLAGTGGLWNTMTMVFRLKTLLDLVRRVMPRIHRAFQSILHAIDTPAEQRIIEELYERIEPMNFSKEVMEKIAQRHPERLSVLAVRNVYWSDWGSSKRIRQTLRLLPQHRRQDNRVPFERTGIWTPHGISGLDLL